MRAELLADADYVDADANRLAFDTAAQAEFGDCLAMCADLWHPPRQGLVQRLGRTRDHLWTFLDETEAPFDNNFAEWQIRPAVPLRKNGQNDRSERGATVQSILMSVYPTLRLRGRDPLQPIAAAPRTCVATGKLPPLPA